jgi:hypothetical protein
MGRTNFFCEGNFWNAKTIILFALLLATVPSLGHGQIGGGPGSTPPGTIGPTDPIDGGPGSTPPGTISPTDPIGGGPGTVPPGTMYPSTAQDYASMLSTTSVTIPGIVDPAENTELKLPLILHLKLLDLSKNTPAPMKTPIVP